MNRRQFLRSALVGLPVVVAPAALLEALMPRKSIFLPPNGGWLVAEESNTVYLVNQDYLVLPPGHEAIIALIQRRMNEAANNMVEFVAAEARAMAEYSSRKPYARIGGIDVYIDRSLPEDTSELRQV